MRAGALSDAEVGEYLNKQFVSAWKRVGTFQVIQKDGKTVARAGGNIAIYFCTPDLRVINAIAGPVGKDALLAAAKWAVETHRKALEQAKDDPEAYVAALRKAHEEEKGKSTTACRAYITLAQASAVPAPCQDVAPSQPKGSGETADRPAPPGRTVYRCVPAEDVAGAQEAKAEVVQALHRVEPQVRRRRAVLVGGGLNLHGYLAQQGLPKLDEVYRHVFEGVLGQQVTDAPVIVREAPQGRNYTCQALAVARREAPAANEVDEIAAKLKSAMEQIELLKKQVEELKKAQ